MERWLLDLVACPFPDCGGALVPRAETSVRDDGTLRCKRCSAVYPVLGGVALLTVDPATYLASHHDAVLATLAEAGSASRSAMRLLDDFASQAGAVTPARFADDWVRGEGEDGAAPVAPLGGSTAAEAFGVFLEATRRDDLGERLLQMLPPGQGAIVEVGPGAGVLSRRLRGRADRLLLVDLSLRAALRARRNARRGRGAPTAAIVADAEQLPVRRRKAHAVVAANVIDLLDQPGAFLASASEALSKRGRLVLSTPAPELGLSTSEPVLAELVSASGLRVCDSADAIPWVRPHGPRHFEVYFVQALAAERA